MIQSAAEFYNVLAERYHLIFQDWSYAIQWQSNVLDQLIRSRLKDQQPIKLLDCSCGIGTQSLGLAQKGYQVTATDISLVSIKRAKKEAEALGIDIQFGVADFRTLEQEVDGSFDVVLSCDNSIPHLLTDEDLILAAKNLYSKVGDDGILLISIRDYEHLIQEKPESTMPRVLDNGNRISFQTWDWEENSDLYHVSQFILQKDKQEWITTSTTTTYRALQRKHLSEILRKIGFKNMEWYMPEESGYYQPILIAQK